MFLMLVCWQDFSPLQLPISGPKLHKTAEFCITNVNFFAQVATLGLYGKRGDPLAPTQFPSAQSWCLSASFRLATTLLLMYWTSWTQRTSY